MRWNDEELEKVKAELEKKFENLIKRAFYRFRRMKIDIRKFIT